jgi:hypothetical protein
MQASGASRREIADAYSVVIARLDREPSIPEAPMIEMMGRSVLDRPVKPGDEGLFFAIVAFPLGPKTLYGAARSAIVELDNLSLSKAWLKAKAFGG